MTETVKVRIAVVVGEAGTYNVAGWRTRTHQTSDSVVMNMALDGHEEEGEEKRYWVEVELPLPKVTMVGADAVTIVPIGDDD